MNTIYTDTSLSYNFLTLTKVLFGTGKINSLHTLQMPGKKAMVVISNGKSTRANGYLDSCLNELKMSNVSFEIFDKVQANPHKETVEEGATFAREKGCDFIVALGGGSVLDAAKVMAMNATNVGDLWDYAVGGSGKAKPRLAEPLPWIAIPTTSGTGSEVDAVGVITNLQNNEKMGIFSSFAQYAIIDPQLTMSVPQKYTAYQGFDAIFHSLEGHICKSRNIMSEMVQNQAIALISENLPKVCKDGNDIDARAKMSFASMLSGYSMVASTCTAEHSIEHALSAYHEELPHGAGLIMISKAYFLTIIKKNVANERFINMAKLMGLSNATRAEDFIIALESLQQKCDVADLKMSDYGIKPDEFDAMAENAITVMSRLTSQDIEPLTHSEIVAILKESYK